MTSPRLMSHVGYPESPERAKSAIWQPRPTRTMQADDATTHLMIRSSTTTPMVLDAWSERRRDPYANTTKPSRLSVTVWNERAAGNQKCALLAPEASKGM